MTKIDRKNTEPPSGPWPIGTMVRKVVRTCLIDDDHLGEVRGYFTVRAGDHTARVVVAHTAEGGGKFCHIYSPDELEAL